MSATAARTVDENPAPTTVATQAVTQSTVSLRHRDRDIAPPGTASDSEYPAAKDSDVLWHSRARPTGTSKPGSVSLTRSEGTLLDEPPSVTPGQQWTRARPRREGSEDSEWTTPEAAARLGPGIRWDGLQERPVYDPCPICPSTIHVQSERPNLSPTAKLTFSPQNAPDTGARTGRI